MVDWALLQKLENQSRQQHERFDTHLSGDIYSVPIRPGLSEGEQKDAEFWQPFRRGLWHVMGQPGGGKDSFVNMVAYKYKYYFGATPILDYKPCSPFGFYEFFDAQLLVEQLQAMAKKTKIDIEEMGDKGTKEEVKEKAFDRLSVEWAKENGNKFRNSVLVLNEYPRYRDKRHNNKPINILMSYIETVFRHWDILVIGIMTNKEMIDFRSFEHLTMKCTCVWNNEAHRSNVVMQPMKFIKSAGVSRASGDFSIYPVDIFKPRAMLLNNNTPLWISELGKNRLDSWVAGEITVEEMKGLVAIKLLNPNYVKGAIDMMMLLANGSPIDINILAKTCRVELASAKEIIFELARCRYIDGLGWKDLFNSKNDVALPIPKSIQKGVLL